MSNSGRNESYQELGRKLRAEGWYKPATGRILLELGIHMALYLGGLAVAVTSTDLVVKALGYLVSVAGGLGITTNSHTSSHYATSRETKLNRFLTYFGFTYLLGVSATYWWHKHCVVHHPTPNLIGIDDDADLMPWFAITEDDFEKSRGLRRLFFRLQWIVIPLAVAVNGINTQRQGWQYLLGQLADRKKRTTVHFIDLGVMLMHVATWIVLPMALFGVLPVAQVVLTEMLLLGYAMFIAFAPAHFPEEALFAGKNHKNDDFVLRQTATTINFRTGWFGRLLLSGVEYQIEHHLFPGIPHVYYPKLSRVVEQYCRRNGYPYRTLGWGEALWKAFLIFRKPKKVAAELNAYPYSVGAVDGDATVLEMSF